jgi:flagellar biosynthesis protein FlhA
MQNLLRERVSVRDLETILETLGNHAAEAKDIDLLTEHVRRSLAGTICRQYADKDNRLSCVTVDPALEEIIGGDVEPAGLGPDEMEHLVDQLSEKTEELSRTGRAPVVLCNSHVRSRLRKLTEASLPRVAVLSFDEISPEVSIEPAGLVGVNG